MSKRIIFYNPETKSELEYKVSDRLYEQYFSDISFLAESGCKEVHFEERKLNIKRRKNA